MDKYLSVLIWCIIVMTGVGIYFPIIYIRKTTKLEKLLNQIEANTRKS